MWFKEPLHSKIKILTFLTPKRLLLVFNGMYNNLRYNIRPYNMILEHFVVAHSRKTPILVIFGPKISKLKLMRYHIRWARGLKFGMDLDMVDSNAHAKKFFSRSTHLGVMTLYLWLVNPKMAKNRGFLATRKKFLVEKIFFHFFSIDLYIWNL